MDDVGDIANDTKLNPNKLIPAEGLKVNSHGPAVAMNMD